MSMAQFEDGKIFYSRKSKYVLGEPTEIFLIARRGVRPYPKEIKERDFIIEIGIKQRHRIDGKVVEVTNTCPFSFQDQWAMWKAIFDNKVLLREKKRQINMLIDLIKELAQTNIDNIFGD